MGEAEAGAGSLAACDSVKRGPGDRWTVLLLRPGDTESRRVDLASPGKLLLILGITLAIFLLGIAAGRLWEHGRAGDRVAELEGELTELQGERERLRGLATRLQSIEASYERIRSALGGEVAASERDVLLPPLSGADGARVQSVREDPAAAEPPWAWPLAQRGFVTRSFGSPLDAAPGGHPGLDVAVPEGSYVRSVGPGVVAEAGRDSVYGFYVRIAHRDNLSSLYAHNSWVFVGAGDTVERLEVIALSGSTGRSTAPHLHFEVERNGVTLDPFRYLTAGR